MKKTFLIIALLVGNFMYAQWTKTDFETITEKINTESKYKVTVFIYGDYLRSMFPDKEFYATIEYDKNPIELREESLVIKQGNTSVMVWYNDITAINSEKMYDQAAGMNDIKITFTTVARGE